MFPLIMLDILLLGPSLHFTTLHPSTLDPTSLPTIQVTISFYSTERSYLYSDSAYTQVTRISRLAPEFPFKF